MSLNELKKKVSDKKLILNWIEELEQKYKSFESDDVLKNSLECAILFNDDKNVKISYLEGILNIIEEKPNEIIRRRCIHLSNLDIYYDSRLKFDKYDNRCNLVSEFQYDEDELVSSVTSHIFSKGSNVVATITEVSDQNYYLFNKNSISISISPDCYLQLIKKVELDDLSSTIELFDRSYEDNGRIYFGKSK